MTSDDATFTDVQVAPDGRTLYALRTSYLEPAHPVRVDLGAFLDSGTAGGRAPVPATPLRGPVATPDLPGTLVDVETAAADDVRVRGWLALPHGASAEDPAPLLLWIHGGPLGSWNAWSWRWNPWLMVAQGYAVLLPDPALSTGYGQDFVQRGWGAWGKAPYTDLLAITDAVEARPEVDATRTAAMGGSFGGYMANWVAGHTDRFRAIVTHASLWALDQFGPTTDHAYYWAREMTDEMALENSPHRFVQDIVTPMLVIHGDKDYRVPIGEGLRLWYELLASSGLPAGPDGDTVHRFLFYPDENHWILQPQHAKVWYQVVLAFLAEHVLGPPRARATPRCRRRSADRAAARGRRPAGLVRRPPSDGRRRPTVAAVRRSPSGDGRRKPCGRRAPAPHETPVGGAARGRPQAVLGRLAVLEERVAVVLERPEQGGAHLGARGGGGQGVVHGPSRRPSFCGGRSAVHTRRRQKSPSVTRLRRLFPERARCLTRGQETASTITPARSRGRENIGQ